MLFFNWALKRRTYAWGVGTLTTLFSTNVTTTLYLPFSLSYNIYRSHLLSVLSLGASNDLLIQSIKWVWQDCSVHKSIKEVPLLEKCHLPPFVPSEQIGYGHFRRYKMASHQYKCVTQKWNRYNTGVTLSKSLCATHWIIYLWAQSAFIKPVSEYHLCSHCLTSWWGLIADKKQKDCQML